jgi:hypothetical protein
MLHAKVSEMGIIIIDTKTGRVVNTIDCARYRGAKQGIIIIDNRDIRVACKDGRTRIFDARTGGLKRTI